MGVVGTAFVLVRPETTGFTGALESKMASQKGALGKIGKAAGLAVASGFGVALVGIGAVIKTGFGEVKDYSAGLAQLQAGIKSTGNQAHVSAAGLENLASKIQDYSGQTDDSIVKSEQLLLTFTSIRNAAGKNNDIFNQATVATANMAAKMGGDASASAIQLGKALNDPIKGVTALQRVGVSFTQQQKDQIKALVESGHVMAAQKIILKELNTEFGGAAKAAGESLPGQLARAKRAFEDLSQSVVTTIMPFVLPAIEAITTTLKRIQPAVTEIAQKAIAAFGSLIGFIVTRVIPVIGSIVSWFRRNLDAAKALAGGISTVLVGAIVLYTAHMVTAAAATFAATWPIYAIAAAVAGVIFVLSKLGVSWSDVWTWIKAVASSAAVDKIVDGVRSAISGLEIAAKWLGDAWPGVWDRMATVTKKFGDQLGSVIGRVDTTKFGDQFGSIVDTISGLISRALPYVQNFVKLIVSSFDSLVAGVRSRWTDIQKVIEHALLAIKIMIGVALLPMLYVWKHFHNEILAVVRAVWNAIKGTVQGALDLLIGVIDVALGLLSGDWSRVWDGLRSVVEGAWKLIHAYIVLGFSIIEQVFKGALGWLATEWQNVWDKIGGVVKTVGGVIMGIIDPIVKAIQWIIDHLSFLGGSGHGAVPKGYKIVNGLMVPVSVAGPGGAPAAANPHAAVAGSPRGTVINYSPTFNQKIDPKHVLQELAWQTAQR